jgi:hypothetical protein
MADDIPDEWIAEPGTRVQHRPPVQGIAKVPAVLHVRAEQLCRLLDAAEEARPERQVLVAALIATAPADAAKLAALLKKYRGLLVRDVLLTDAAGSTVDLREEMERAKTPADPT